MAETKRWANRPWRLWLDDGNQIAIAADDKEHPLVCTVSKGHLRPHGDAHAALLLAAPDLYAVLDDLVIRASRPGSFERWDEAMDRARAALAKARGETP